MNGKVKTHIEGFDEVLDGGIPAGHNVIVAGTPGTMKSSLAYYILRRNASLDMRKGLYISLEQSRASLLDHMNAMGMAPDKAGESISILDLSQIRKKMRDAEEDVWMDFFKMYAKSIKKSFDYDLLVVDSIDALEALAKFKNHRMEFFRFFKWLRKLNVTSFIISEMPQVVLPLGISVDEWCSFGKHKEDYLADGIILLKMEKRGDFQVQRRIRCVKMRSVKHETKYFALVYEGNRFQITTIMA